MGNTRGFSSACLYLLLLWYSPATFVLYSSFILLRPTDTHTNEFNIFFHHMLHVVSTIYINTWRSCTFFLWYSVSIFFTNLFIIILSSNLLRIKNLKLIHFSTYSSTSLILQEIFLFFIHAWSALLSIPNVDTSFLLKYFLPDCYFQKRTFPW